MFVVVKCCARWKKEEDALPPRGCENAHRVQSVMCKRGIIVVCVNEYFKF